VKRRPRRQRFPATTQGPRGLRRLGQDEQDDRGQLEDRKKHRRYAKVMRSTNKVKAHDEGNTAGVGDRSADHGDPSAVGDQALAAGGDSREGQVGRTARVRSEIWRATTGQELL